MSAFNAFITETFEATKDTFLEKFHDELQSALQEFYLQRKHGREDEWDTAFNLLPDLTASDSHLSRDTVQIGTPKDLKSDIDLKAHLMTFHPWRKGPFNLFGTFIDTEWRSDWKWNRLQTHISPLEDRNILDLGCGNGYHLFRMLGQGAKMALGVDPTRVFLYQFNLIKRYLGTAPAYLLPLKSEHLPKFMCFDSVFSMGVLYHRRSPLDHLAELHQFLRPGGELVLETLVLDEEVLDEEVLDKDQRENPHKVLVPEDRYAKMANVWFIPSTHLLELWLKRTGFVNVRTVDVSQTSLEEQRSTEWMTFQSLTDFLDPKDTNKTVEGYPAPKRAIILAETR